jgi:hypothetical protein
MVLIYRFLLKERLKGPADILGKLSMVLINRFLLKEGLKEPANTLDY